MADKPTQDEIARVTEYLTKRSCAETGHAPSQHIATYGDPVGVYYCGCGAAIWTPKVTA